MTEKSKADSTDNSKNTSDLTSKTAELKPLYPQYDESSHSPYVKRLEKALRGEDTKIHNIALSGVYGSGKSSILEKVVEDLEEERPHTTRTISLAPLAAQLKEQDDKKTDFVSDKDGSASKEPSGASPKPSNDSSITNLIQKEIIKQLLYGTDPKKIPASHFHRMNEIGLGKQLLSSLAFGMLLLFILNIYKWPYSYIQKPLTWLPIPTSITKILAEIVIIGLLSIATFALLHYFGTRIHLAKIDVGTAGITLGENSDSYFDQYLDEIIYIFEKTGIRTVFFEDLDRFQDAQIFDSLRELNQFLNNDPKLQRTKSTIQKISRRLHFSRFVEEKNSQSSAPIQFVYAIHDAIFSNQYVLADEQVSNKESLSHSFSRAKFFDLIIPVVPFVSASNSYQIALETLEDVFDANDPQMINLLELVADAVPDKRTWINIRNEFIVYREHLFVQSPEGRFTSKLGLEEPHLLAFIIYKNCYLDDSVKIHDGKSKLDSFYNHARELTKQKLPDLINQTHKLEDQISKFTDESCAEKHALELKAKLCRFMALVANVSEDDDASLEIGFNANNASDASKPQAWEKLSGCGEADRIYVKYDSRWTRTETRLIPYSLLRRVMNTSLDIGQWEEAQKINLTNKNADLSKTIEDLRSGDWTFILQFEESQTKESQTTLGKDFYALLDGNISLLYRLISHGWIGQDYMLYSTIYTDEGITRNALNFILHHIDGNNPDYQFKLDDEDSEDVLRRIRRKDRAIFHQHRVLNIDLLHYMQSHCDDSDTRRDTNQIIEMLSPLDNETAEFVSAYLDRLDDDASPLIAEMASHSQNLLSFLVQRGTTDTDTLCKQLDVAFHHLSREIQYTVDGNLADFLQNHWRSIPIFKDSNIAPSLVEPMIQILNDGKVRIDSLSELGYKDSNSGLRYPCAEQNLYVFSRSNLETALDTISQSDNNQDDSYSGCDRLPALNTIMHVSRTVYANVLGHLEEYFGLLTEDEYTLDCSPDQNIADDLFRILDNICQQAGEEEDAEKLIHTLLNRCSPPARLPLFDNRFENYADALMECDAVHFTPMNLQWAFTHDALTEHESSMTTWIQKHDSFEQGDTDENLDKEKLAEDTINLPSTILKSDKKIQLLQELKLNVPIPTSSIEPDKQNLEQCPEIYAQLLKNGLVADTAESFKALDGLPWPVREAWIRESQKFADYLGDANLRPNEACYIVCNKDSRLKKSAEAIMDNFRDYTEGADEPDLLNASAALIREGRALDEATRQELAEYDDGLDNTLFLLDAGLERQSTIAMFADALEYAASRDQPENKIVEKMKQLFQKLGDEYLKFTDPNSKCITLPNTAENQQIIQAIPHWNSQLIPQTEEINEENLIKIRRDQKLWNGFFKQDK